MEYILNAIQIAAILITVAGIYFLSRKEQNKLSMYLMLSTVGCLIVNCSYLLLMRASTAQEGLLALRMESIGNTLLYYFLHMFVIEYLKLRRVKWFMTIWAAVDCLNFYCFWNDRTLPLVYKSLSFVCDESMGIMRISREMGLLQMIRNGIIAFVMAGTLLYMMFRLFCGRIEVKSERNNLARLIGADFVIVGIMSATMIMNQGFNIAPLCTAFAIVMIIQGVFKGELLSAVDTGRQWMIENMDSAFVVDDSGAMLRNVKGWLEEKYQVILANSGAMAIKYLTLNRPDLILLDYEMPIVNGKQVLEMIRSEMDFSDVPVIFLTSKDDRETVLSVMEMKPEGYLLKSLRPEQIVQAVDHFFAHKKWTNMVDGE